MGKRAKIIHVIPTIGGCGSTTVACNVAASLAAQAARRALIDLDLIRGGVASYFDIAPALHHRRRHGFGREGRQAAARQRTGDSSRRATWRSWPGRICPKTRSASTRPGMQRLFGVLGRMFDYVVIDSVMSIDPIYATAIAGGGCERDRDAAQRSQRARTPSDLSARCAGWASTSSKIRIVVNRFVKKGWDIEPDEVERALGLKICVDGSQRFQERDRGDQLRRAGGAAGAAKRDEHEPDGPGRRCSATRPRRSSRSSRRRCRRLHDRDDLS